MCLHGTRPSIFTNLNAYFIKIINTKNFFNKSGYVPVFKAGNSRGKNKTCK